jgi:Flp pilus assembly protein TadG
MIAINQETDAGADRTRQGAAKDPQGGRRWRGQALVEFAIISTFLAFLLIGVVDFGRVFYFDLTASAAANEAVRAAVRGLSDADVRAAAERSAPGVPLTISVSPAQASRTYQSACSPSTCPWVTVTVRYTFSPITPGATRFFGNNIAFERKVSQRMVQ